MKPSRIIVTGATGFIGGHTALELSRSGYDVIAVGGRRPHPQEFVGSTAECVSCDLTDAAAVGELISRFSPDFLIHTAALARTADCERDPVLAEISNTEATANIARSLRDQASSALLIYLSTDLVFDGYLECTPGGFIESDEPRPKSVYSRTKLSGEAAVFKYFENSIVARSCIVYGTPIGGRAGFLNWLVGQFKKGESVDLFADEIRTPVAIWDLTRLIRALVENPKAMFDQGRIEPANRILHVAGKDSCSRYDFGIELAKRFGIDTGLIQKVSQGTASTGQDQPLRPRDVSLSIARASTLLGYVPDDYRTGISKLRADDFRLDVGLKP